MQEIDSTQIVREHEIDRKYRTSEEIDAARTIQRTYRGHRQRRQLDGLILNPSERWSEAIKEWRWREAIAVQVSPSTTTEGRHRAISDSAKANWQRVKYIAEHASADGRSSASVPTSRETQDSTGKNKANESLLMDTRYFLEMVDQKHRYGANLKVYHEEWQRTRSDQNFFWWLDRGSGRSLNLPGCSRQKLDSERVRYLTREERMDYLVRVDTDGRLCWAKSGERITTSNTQYQDSMHGIVPFGSPNENFHDKTAQERLAEEALVTSDIAALGSPDRDGCAQEPFGSNAAHVCANAANVNQSQEASASGGEEHHRRRLFASPATILHHLLQATVKPGTWIYVADTMGQLYVGIKANGEFQHASFLAGARISSAGLIGIEDGQVTYLSPLSGHYRPTTRSFKLFIEHLKEAGVDVSRLKTSSAYAVLLGMEYYNKTKTGIRRLVHHRHTHE